MFLINHINISKYKHLIELSHSEVSTPIYIIVITTPQKIKNKKKKKPKIALNN